jgi:hypothetical protein
VFTWQGGDASIDVYYNDCNGVSQFTAVSDGVPKNVCVQTSSPGISWSGGSVSTLPCNSGEGYVSCLDDSYCTSCTP